MTRAIFDRMPTTRDLPPGLVSALEGTYELLQEIGRGGMGVVYAGRDIRLDRLVAIKVLPDLVSSDIVRERFLREARAAARLSHPSIVPIYSADERGGVTFLVMAYVDGTTLSARLRDGAALSTPDAVPILRDVALALGAAHARGVVHRDIKPENILVDRATGRAMVTDFGIARLADAMQSGALTRTGQVLGTVGYMSPEQVTGSEVDGRSDLYSLGVVAFETLSGRLPFDGPAPVVIVAHATKPAPPLASVAPGVPAELCAIVDRCLMKNPADRFASGDELAAALEAAVGRSVATAPAQLARDNEGRVLSESDANRVWQRAAELQAGIGSATSPRAPTSSITVVPRSSSNGFKVEHVRQAALDVGISAAYVTLALDEVLRRGQPAPMRLDVGAAGPAAVARGPAASALLAQVQTLSKSSSVLAGAPTTLIYEAEVHGQLSPNDFDVIAQTIRNIIGEAGVATALGRTLSWSLGGMQNQRRLHVSITATGGRTTIRAEERLGQSAGGIFGSIVGGVGGGLGTASVGVTMGHMHNPLLAIGVLTFLVGTAYTVARGIFTSTSRTRARQLEHLVSTLAAQSTELIADDRVPRLPR
ncbi:MAG: serine/threonine protein kinase [Gemmatimonadota bacterium]|nr:serine/threonine protein kinase [Gemmatimonadota bacterium]